MRQATTLLALTEAEVSSYRALGVATPCRVVPNGVDVTRYRTAPTLSPAALAGIAEDALVVLFLGRLHPIKGADILMDAFSELLGPAAAQGDGVAGDGDGGARLHLGHHRPPPGRRLKESHPRERNARSLCGKPAAHRQQSAAHEFSITSAPSRRKPGSTLCNAANLRAVPAFERRPFLL
jgi:hypothetical protein